MKLFICYTPLHVLIAQKVIAFTKIDEYSFIYFDDYGSDKSTHYYNLLQENSQYSIRIPRTKKYFTDFKNIYKVYRQLKLRVSLENVTIYTGNIKAMHTRLLMLLLSYKELHTFDDGCANVADTGYYANNNENILYQLFFTLIKPSLVYKNLRQSMVVHYSIFKEKNIYPNVTYIDLFNKVEKQSFNLKPQLTILLTSVLSENKIIGIESEVELNRNIITHFNVNKIIPHPGSTQLNLYNNVEIIHSALISEEIIFNLSETYDLTIIGIFSSTLLNLSGINLIKKIISIDFPNSHINSELVDLFKRRNIECYKNIDNNFVKL